MNVKKLEAFYCSPGSRAEQLLSLCVKANYKSLFDELPTYQLLQSDVAQMLALTAMVKQFGRQVGARLPAPPLPSCRQLA